MSALLLSAVLAAGVGAGYGLRVVRPARALFDWAEVQFDGDGWASWVRRYPAFMILGAAMLLHPLKTLAAYRLNRSRQQQAVVFTGAMRPAYDPDWHKDKEQS